MQMQRMCKFSGSVKSYLEDPVCLLNTDTRACPFCSSHHSLWRHGWYSRWILLPDPADPERIPILRLLCHSTGKTVSLLPDFCLPRRQHSPVFLAYFLKGIVVMGLTMVSAYKALRKETPCHSTAQGLLQGFTSRSRKIQVYLARWQPRLEETTNSSPPTHKLLATLFHGLARGFPDVDQAFLHHGLHFHRKFKIGLA